MLYPTELSSGGRTGFEPAADGFRRCSASELPSSRNTFSHASAYATARPRAPDGIASRAAVACSIDVPYCRLSPTGNSYRRIAPYASQTQPRAARVEASPRGAHAPVAAAPLPRARVVANPDASGRKMPCKSRVSVCWLCGTLALHALPSRTLETKRPRDLRPEGVRVASGDRGGRSPMESDRYQVWRYQLRSPIRRSPCFVQARASAPRRIGHSANRSALTKFGFIGKSCVEKTPQGRRPRTIPVFFGMRNNFLTMKLQSRRTVQMRRSTLHNKNKEVGR